MDAGEAIQCSVFQGKILESHKVLDIGAAVSAAEHPGLLHGADGVGRRHPRNRRHARHLLLGKPHVDYNAPLIHPAVGIGQGQQHIFYLGKGIVEGKLFDMVGQHLYFAHQGANQVVHQRGVLGYSVYKFIHRDRVNLGIAVGAGLGGATAHFIAKTFAKKAARVCHIQAMDIALAVGHGYVYPPVLDQVHAVFRPLLIVDRLALAVAARRVIFHQFIPIHFVQYDPG